MPEGFSHAHELMCMSLCMLCIVVSMQCHFADQRCFVWCFDATLFAAQRRSITEAVVDDLVLWSGLAANWVCIASM